MKKYFVIISLIFSLVIISATSFADNNIIAATDTDNVVKIKPVIKTEPSNKDVKKSKSQLKAEKKLADTKIKANKKIEKEEAKLNNKIAKEQAKEQAKLEKQQQKIAAKEKKLAEKNAKIQQKEAAKQAKIEKEIAQKQLKENQKALKAEEKLKKNKAQKNDSKTKNVNMVKNEKMNVQEEKPTVAPVPVSPVEVKNQKQEIQTPKEVSPVKNSQPKSTAEQTNTLVNTIEKPARIINSQAESEIKTFFEHFSTLQNKHNISELKNLYADNFMNTDGYNKQQLFKLMKRTFDSYPDLKTEFNIQQIVATSDFAMVYVRENITATTKSESKITNDKGSYVSELHDIFYLKKLNNTWTIYSEDVVYEVSKLAHGSAKNINASISAPQKVLSNSEYTASAHVDIPNGYNAIGSVNSTQIVDGFNMSGESFRQFKSKDTDLERLLIANDKGNNEAVVVSIGLTEVTQDMFKKAKIDLSGLIILMQRVDVIPTNSNFKAAKEYSSEY